METSDPHSTTPGVSGNEPGRILEKESLGEYLRKVRIGNRVDLQKMSKDTRLTLEYLNAIEKNELDKIPGETYRKIFIKNVAKYLELDPEEIYNRYLKESHGSAPQPISSTPVQHPIKPQEPAPAQPSTAVPGPATPAKSTKPLLVTLGIIFIILLIVLSQTEKNSASNFTSLTEQEADTSLMTDSDSTSVSNTPQPAGTAAAANRHADTAKMAQLTEAPIISPPPEITEDSTASPEKKRFSADKKGSIKMEVVCTKDSLYVYAWRLGRTWNNLMREGDSKVFASDSTVYFKLTPAANAQIRIAGKEITPEPPRGETVIRADSQGISYLPTKRWDTISRRH